MLLNSDQPWSVSMSRWKYLFVGENHAYICLYKPHVPAYEPYWPVEGLNHSRVLTAVNLFTVAKYAHMQVNTHTHIGTHSHRRAPNVFLSSCPPPLTLTFVTDRFHRHADVSWDQNLLSMARIAPNRHSCILLLIEYLQVAVIYNEMTSWQQMNGIELYSV